MRSLGEGAVATGALTITAFAVGCARGLSLESMWLDRAFVSFRYAFSFGNGKGGRLPGQSDPVVGFLDPSWTALMTAIHGLGLQPVRVVQIIGPVFFGLLLATCVYEIWRRHRRLLPLLPAVILAAAAPAEDPTIADDTPVTMIAAADPAPPEVPVVELSEAPQPPCPPDVVWKGR